MALSLRRIGNSRSRGEKKLESPVQRTGRWEPRGPLGSEIHRAPLAAASIEDPRIAFPLDIGSFHHGIPFDPPQTLFRVEVHTAFGIHSEGLIKGREPISDGGSPRMPSNLPSVKRDNPCWVLNQSVPSGVEAMAETGPAVRPSVPLGSFKCLSDGIQTRDPFRFQSKRAIRTGMDGGPRLSMRPSRSEKLMNLEPSEMGESGRRGEPKGPISGKAQIANLIGRQSIAGGVRRQRLPRNGAIWKSAVRV